MRDNTNPTGIPALNVVLDDYRRRASVVALDAYPLIWCGHYGSGVNLGEFSSPILPNGLTVAQVGLGMMAPFGVSPETTASALVVDSFRVDPFCAVPTLHVSMLAVVNERSILRTHWQVTDVTDKAPTPYEGWDKALSDITERRQRGPDHPFSEAYDGSLHILRSLLA